MDKAGKHDGGLLCAQTIRGVLEPRVQGHEQIVVEIGKGGEWAVHIYLENDLKRGLALKPRVSWSSTMERRPFVIKRRVSSEHWTTQVSPDQKKEA